MRFLYAGFATAPFSPPQVTTFIGNRAFLKRSFSPPQGTTFVKNSLKYEKTGLLQNLHTENAFQLSLLNRVNGVYRDYGGGLVIKTTVTQEKNFDFF